MKAWIRSNPKLAVFLGLLAFAFLKSAVSPEPPKPAAPKREPGIRRMVSTHFGCTTPTLYREVAHLMDDREAFQRAMTVALARGACVAFDRNETVTVTDVETFGGVVRIRAAGSPLSYWTTIRAIE